MRNLYGLYGVCCGLLLAAAVCEARREDDEGALRYRVELDTAGKFLLHWDVDEATESIEFQLDAEMNSDDVLGFGFSDYGEVQHADLVVMWTDRRGKHHFQVTSPSVCV